MQLNTIHDRRRARQARKRVGRGPGSGTGGTSGRGQNGQLSRSGASRKGFEGGQMPLYRRLPKRGFSNFPFRRDVEHVNLLDVERLVQRGRVSKGQSLDGAVLAKLGLIRGRRHALIKLLGKGEISVPLSFRVDLASASAVAAVEKLGGSVVCVAGSKESESGDANSSEAG